MLPGLMSRWMMPAALAAAIDRDLALQSKRLRLSAETVQGNNNLALQAFTRFEWFFQDAKESLAAEVFGGGLNWRRV